MKEIGQRGAALVTVMLFMVILLILISAMLTLSGNEILISGMQRDGIRALELAEAAVREGEQRLREGVCCDEFPKTFDSSLVLEAALSDDVTAVQTTILRRDSGELGLDRALLEIQGEAKVRNSVRRVSILALIESQGGVADVVYGFGLALFAGNAMVKCGDVYAHTFVEYQTLPTNDCVPPEPETVTYAGWWIRKGPGKPGDTKVVPPCYTRKQCEDSGQDRWFPSTRVSASEDSDDAAERAIAEKIHQWQDANLTPPASGCGTCPGGGTCTFADEADPEYRLADNTTVTGDKCLYGYDPAEVDGTLLPFKWVRKEVFDPLDNTTKPVWFKTIVYEDWFPKYFPGGEKSAVLDPDDPGFQVHYPAIPAFPNFSNLWATCTPGSTFSGGGVITQEILGSPGNEKLVCLEGPGEWRINADNGAGTLLVDADLVFGANFDYTGTIYATRKVDGSGRATITGGLIVRDLLGRQGTATFDLIAGTNVVNIPAGTKIVIVKAWWER